MKYIIAYDLGTGGMKASLFDEDGNNLENAFVECKTYYPKDEFREQKPSDWWDMLVSSTENLLSKVNVDKEDIVGAGCSGHSLGVVPIEDKKGFITGGAQGIGKCLAEAFAMMGADVAIVDINLDVATATAKEISEKSSRLIKAYQCNIVDDVSVDAMMVAYLKDYGTIDFCINNAGIATFDSAMDISASDFKRVVDVDLNGTFLTARAAAKVMMDQGKAGSIVSTASMSASLVNVPQTIASYCAAKAGVVHLTRALSVEWAKYNIRVNCVSPGYMLTELVEALGDMHPIWLSKLPEGSRLGKPEDLIGAYTYFISDASKYATGSELIVDGGYNCL